MGEVDRGLNRFFYPDPGNLVQQNGNCNRDDHTGDELQERNEQGIPDYPAEVGIAEDVAEVLQPRPFLLEEGHGEVVAHEGNGEPEEGTVVVDEYHQESRQEHQVERGLDPYSGLRLLA